LTDWTTTIGSGSRIKGFVSVERVMKRYRLAVLIMSRTGALKN
jgi:hypothetical protein